jgi:hypothetical protein
MAPEDEAVIPDPALAVTDPSQAEAQAEEEESWEDQRRKIPLRVDVEWLDFDHFKNRYSEKEGLAILEVLIGHPQIAQDVARETSRRGNRCDIRFPGPMPKPPVVDGESCWPQRIRIQSPELILLLSRLSGHRDTWTTTNPRTFFAPFRGFHHYLPQLKESLKILKTIWPTEDDAGDGTASKTPKSSAGDLKDDHKLNTESAKTGDGSGNANGSDTSDSDSDSDADDVAHLDSGPMSADVAVSGDVVDSAVTLAHLQKFVDFIDEHLEPLWRRAAGTSQRKFRFADLWMVFQPDEVVYVASASDSSQPENSHIARSSDGERYQTAWRFYSLVLYAVQDDRPDDTAKISKRKLEVCVYYLDYDGDSYVPARTRFTINHYDGEKDITSLPVYPLRFLKDADKIKEDLRQQGLWFRQAVTEKHLYYDGWTLSHGPTGASSDSKKSGIRGVQHIDGDVIIDFVEGFKSEATLNGMGPSSWSKGLATFDDTNWPTGDDNLSIVHWKPSGSGAGAGLKPFAHIREKTQRGEWFCDRMKQEHLEIRKNIKAHAEGKPVKDKDLEEDELLLLPRRVVAYVFRERQFFMLDTKSLKKLPVSDNVFNDLKIDLSHKAMVISLVKSHLDKQAAQKMRPSISMNQDLIRGKGSGLVILLHGVPGVGKTATAEAVAQANNKPLFVITCGDLGFTPKEVEDSLKDIFRLAHLWDCVLLLDEADIFLSRRELGDLKRNALVSVFLRVLEYYSGILFLTTNRVGHLDEAFKSRIHVSLYYPRLDEDQTVEIFKVNIRKLREIVQQKQKLQADLDPKAKRPPLFISDQDILDYAVWHYKINEETPELRWNGRQIRNAFQIAYSLAEFDMRSTLVAQEGERSKGILHLGAGDGRLDWRQFDMVAAAIEKFEDYLQCATNGTDGDRARTAFIRADEWDHRNSPQKPAYTPPAYRRAPPGRRAGAAPNAPPGQNRPQYRPRFQPRSDEQLTTGRGPPGAKLQGAVKPDQRNINVPGGPASTRRQPYPGGVSRNAGSQPITPKPASGNVKSRGPTSNNRNDSGYSGWSTDPQASDNRGQEDWRRNGRRQDGSYQQDETHDDGVQYEQVDYGNAEEYPEYFDTEDPFEGNGQDEYFDMNDVEQYRGQ